MHIKRLASEGRVWGIIFDQRSAHGLRVCSSSTQTFSYSSPATDALSDAFRALPPATIPFIPLPTPRPRLSPVGPKAMLERSAEEHMLHGIFDRVARAHPTLFRGSLAPERFRFEYQPAMGRTARADESRLVVEVSSRFFAKVRGEAQAAAIVCHELSHVLLGHPNFSSPPPPLVLDDPRYQRQLRKVEAARKALGLETLAAATQRFDRAEAALRQRHETLYPGELQALVQTQSGSSGSSGPSGSSTSEWAWRRAELLDRLEHFARRDDSPQARAYLRELCVERAQQCRQERFVRENAELTATIDEILQEPGASHNWTEAQADVLGLRLLMGAGYSPRAFLLALVNTLDDGSGELERYLRDIETQLSTGVAPQAIPVPERGAGLHPRAKWRIYNIAVRELKLRYPAEYGELCASRRGKADRGLGALSSMAGPGGRRRGGVLHWREAFAPREVESVEG